MASKHAREAEVVAAFTRFFDAMPERRQQRWQVTYDSAIGRGDSDVDAAIAAWTDLGIDMLPHPSGVIRIDELRGKVRTDEWDEALHPRDADGKFGSGAGVATSTAAASTAATARPAAVARAPKAEPAPTPDPPKYSASAAGARSAVATAVAERAADKGYKAPDTLALYQRDGRWQAARVAEVHDKYIADKLAGTRKAEGAVTLRMTGGGPASGKSTALLSQEVVGIPGKGEAAHFDADDAKANIPEYARGIAAGDAAAAASTHEESSHMAKRGVREALAAGYSVVHDGVGDDGVANVAGKVAAFRAAAGRPIRVVADYATIDPEVARARANLRAAVSGRVIPPDVFNAKHADVNSTAWAAGQRDVFDAITVWDSDVPMGEPPIKVWSKARGEDVVVHDEALFAKFKQRAGVRGDAAAALTTARMYEILVRFAAGKLDEGALTDDEAQFLARTLAALAAARVVNPDAFIHLPADL